MNGVVYRPLEPDDERFVRGTWLHHARRRIWARSPIGADYDEGHSRAIDRALRSLRTKVEVAADVEDPYVILGWACTEPGDCLHYVYVKPPFRAAHIGRELMRRAQLLDVNPLVVSHWAPDLKRVLGKGRWFRYDPYRFFNLEDQ